MSHNGHKQNVHKPTGLDVYHDAAKILEELLDKRFDDSLKLLPKVYRNKTDPSSKRVQIDSRSENAILRSKIVPYRHSKSLDENRKKDENKRKDVNSPQNKTFQENTKRVQHGGSESSIDTDVDDQALAANKREKKNLFKRAKERLFHTFHRDQKEGFATATDKSKNEISSTKKEKMKDKQERGEDINLSHPHINVDTSYLTLPLSPADLSDDRKLSLQPGSLSSQSRSPSASANSLNLTVKVPGVITGSTSESSCNTFQPEIISCGSTTNMLSSIQSNILDSPGEDIEYMDIDSTSRNNSAEINNLIHNSEGFLDMTRPAFQPSGLIHSVQRVISTSLDGTIETTSTVTTIEKANVPKQGEFENQQSQSEKSDSSREAIYGKIAQRLIEMGDLLSASTSDQELVGAAAAQPCLPLTELEKDIIACLRTGGDRYSKQLDESFEEMTQQTTQEAYQRFHSTMQNSMGNELSWDHLAFLFYTTKGVVSTVGEGSRKAKQVKEFTLHYISDTFASWIMDQGGFDSVLSSGESDFDVD